MTATTSSVTSAQAKLKFSQRLILAPLPCKQYITRQNTERRNHYAVHAVSTAANGFDTNRESFIGTYGSPAMPKAVKEGTSYNSIASGWSPVGSFRIDIDLEPGEEKEYVFIIGYVENPDDKKWESFGIINKEPAYALLEKYNTPAKFDTALAALKNYWTHLLSSYIVDTEDKKLCRMVNIWNQYQCMVTFNMSRSASYYESGTGRGMGFRDSCQDLLGFVHLIPDSARQRILDIAATQFEDGSAYHQYQPLTKKGNLDIGSGFNDDPLWLIAGTAAYIKETGDYFFPDWQKHIATAEEIDAMSKEELIAYLARSIINASVGYMYIPEITAVIPRLFRVSLTCLRISSPTTSIPVSTSTQVI